MSCSEQFKNKFPRLALSGKGLSLVEKINTMSMRADKERRILELMLGLESRVEPKDIFALEKQIEEAYGLSQVRVFPSYAKECFCAEIYPDLICYYTRVSGFSLGFFEGCKCVYNANSGVLKFTLRDGVSCSLVEDCGAERFFEQCVKQQYGLDITVKIEGNEVDPASYQAPGIEKLMEERDKELEAEKERVIKKEAMPEVNNCFDPKEESKINTYIKDDREYVECGRMTFDITEPQKIYGRQKKAALIPIRDIKDGMTVHFAGVMFSIEEKENFDGNKTNYRIYLTDLESSVITRLSLDRDTPLADIKEQTPLIIDGKAEYSKYDNEVVVKISAITQIKRVFRQDGAKETRIELHAHTNMSQMDALTVPEALIKRAAAWNMPAIAVTDHGTLQAFPEIMKACKKEKSVKPIYGMEGYLVDDTARAVFRYDSASNTAFAGTEFVIFDIETTGLSAKTCGITQIAALLYKDGENIKTFETFVNPNMPIPQNIVELTGITDDMVKDAPSEAEAVSSFLEFAGDRMLVAHNAPFDIGFIREVSQRNGLKFRNSYLDTVSLSRYINSDSARHTLDALSRYFKLGEFDHHKANADTEMLALIFGCLVRKLATNGILTINEMNDAMAHNSDPKRLRSYHIIILVKNQTGLKNLYKLVSRSYLDFYFKHPRIPKTLLSEMREGLIIGSACCYGELYQGILDGKRESELKRIAEFYDYLEIQPHSNNYFLVKEGKLGDDRAKAEKQLDENDFTIVNLAKKLGKPFVATGDVHFLDPQDELYRQILMQGMGFSDAMSETKLYLKTTDEMLEAFSFLGDEDAYNAVIKNPRDIADQIEQIKPIPDGTYTPEIEGASEELRKVCFDTAKSIYGDPLPDIVQNRLERELSSVIKHGFAVLYIIARKLVQNSEEHGYLVGSRGSVGSSVIASFAGISEVNPLPPHYVCPKCKKSIFVTDGSVGSGFDMPDRNCPDCNEKMRVDGHDIPFETFLGFDGDKAPDIDLNFSGAVQGEAHKFTEVLFGKENIFRAGTVGTLQSKTCYGYVKKFLEEQHKALTKAEENRLVNGCVGIKRTTGQHPGGIVVIPKQYEIYDFTPVQYPADKESSGVITTHFAFDYLHDTLLKLDILGHDVPSFYKVLEDYTGIDVRTVPMNDEKVYGLFSSTKPLGITEEQISCPIGTYGLPEFGTKYAIQMIIDAQPKNFSDLLQISGLSHGTGIWLGNGKELIKNGTCTINEIIGTRDSIMLYLIKKGLDSLLSFKIMESVRKGRGVSEEQEKAMQAQNVPEWYIDSCKKIKYMFPKAHAAAYTIASLRLGWFKVYRPIEFYATYFTVKSDNFDGELVMQGEARIKREIKALAEMPNPTAKQEDSVVFMQMVIEMFARGLSFLPVDIFKSKAQAFVPENGKIRLPLSSLNGLGVNAAINIREAIDSGKATTLEELKTEAGINKNIVDILKSNNCLAGLPESSQLTLF